MAPAVTDEPPSPDQAEIERRWPEALRLARELREVFGDGVRLMYARNAAGEELKRRGWRR